MKRSLQKLLLVCFALLQCALPLTHVYFEGVERMESIYNISDQLDVAECHVENPSQTQLSLPQVRFRCQRLSAQAIVLVSSLPASFDPLIGKQGWRIHHPVFRLPPRHALTWSQAPPALLPLV